MVPAIHTNAKVYFPVGVSTLTRHALLPVRGLAGTIGHYVFHGGPEQLEALRTCLSKPERNLAEAERRRRSIQGLHATAERAVRLTNPEHWPLVTVRREDGSEIEVRQFPAAPGRDSA